MATKQQALVGFIVLCSVLSGSCDEDLYSPNWVNLNYEQFVQAIAEPTGELVGGDVQTTVDAMEDHLGYTPDVVEDTLLLYQQLEVMLDVLEDSQDQEQEANTTTKGKVRGTNIYGRISCLGPDPSNRDLDFQHGEIRLEGSQFSLDDAVKSGFKLGGDMLTAFRDCRMGDRIMRGLSPGFANTRSAEILVDLDITVEEDSGSEHTARYPFLVRKSQINILADTGEGGTYVLSIAVGRDTVITLTTAQGSYGCSIGVSGLECDATAISEN